MATQSLLMREVREVRQDPGGPRRRWFTNDFFDLLVWTAEDGAILAFQLSYDKPGYERALTWDREQGYGHSRVDDGEDQLGRIKASPILVVDGVFDFRSIAARFDEQAADLDPGLVAFVHGKILEFGAEEGGES